MSLDYPCYQELCRRKHPAAWWWIIGDRLYYLGLIPALMAVPGAGLAIVAGLLGWGWGRLAVAASIAVGGAIVFALGVRLKQHAYRLAARDGIRFDEPEVESS